MDVEAASVAMLYQDPHPAHRGFAESIDADLIDYHHFGAGPFNETLVDDLASAVTYPDYDVYLLEGSRPLYAGLLRRFTRGGHIIYLAADHGLYQLGSESFEGTTRMKSFIGRFGRPLARAVGSRGIDGVIAVSEFVAEFTRPFVGAETPIEIAHPYIDSETYSTLGKVEPSLDSNVAVTVTRPWQYKGVDMLVEAWPQIRTVHADAELYVVGEGHPTTYEETPGVDVCGFVDDLGTVFEDASLYVQPSRVDAFPVGTLEAMRAGLPPIVTQTTGTRSEAAEIDDSLVVDPTPTALADGVINYFDKPFDQRQQLGDRARHRSRRFDKESRTNAFAKTVRQILKVL